MQRRGRHREHLNLRAHNIKKIVIVQKLVLKGQCHENVCQCLKRVFVKTPPAEPRVIVKTPPAEPRVIVKTPPTEPRVIVKTPCTY